MVVTCSLTHAVPTCLLPPASWLMGFVLRPPTGLWRPWWLVRGHQGTSFRTTCTSQLSDRPCVWEQDQRDSGHRERAALHLGDGSMSVSVLSPSVPKRLLPSPAGGVGYQSPYLPVFCFDLGFTLPPNPQWPELCPKTLHTYLIPAVCPHQWVCGARGTPGAAGVSCCGTGSMTPPPHRNR